MPSLTSTLAIRFQAIDESLVEASLPKPSVALVVKSDAGVTWRDHRHKHTKTYCTTSPEAFPHLLCDEIVKALLDFSFPLFLNKLVKFVENDDSTTWEGIA